MIVACSGGADSLALAAAAVTCCAGRRFIGATVDHGLQTGSAERATVTAEVLSGLGFGEVEVLPVRVTGPGGMEAAARRARYGALGRLAASVSTAAPGAVPGAAVLLAHTADDQAETVLLGLARGSGPRSIAGMRPWRAPWGRPLLGLTRSDTEGFCRAVGLTPWADPHNVDPAFTRVRLRREVLPLLEDVLGGGVRDALARTAVLMADDLDALEEIAGVTLRRATRLNPGVSPGIDPPIELAADPPIDPPIDLAALAGVPVAVVGRVLRRWLTEAAVVSLTFDQLRRITAQARDSAGPVEVRVAGGVDVVRVSGTLVIRRPADAP